MGDGRARKVGICSGRRRRRLLLRRKDRRKGRLDSRELRKQRLEMRMKSARVGVWQLDDDTKPHVCRRRRLKEARGSDEIARAAQRAGLLQSKETPISGQL